MGKAARLRDRRSKGHIKVDDAASVIAALQSWASQARATNASGQWMQDVAKFAYDKWIDSPVVLRVDNEFAGALMNSNTDVELVPDWLTRFPFDAIAFSLATPLSLHDGHRMCHYLGMIVVGANNVRYGSMTTPLERPESERFQSAGAMFTRYVKIPTAQGVRCLWVFKEDGDPAPQVQSVTFPLRGAAVATDKTLANLIDAQIAIAKEVGHSEGVELPVLIPLSLSLLLYTAATDPEIDWPPAQDVTRPQQLREAAVGHLGWRTGAALRQHRTRPSGPGEDGGAGLGGWRLPPHIRKAHWHRVRIVERDDSGRAIGRRDGVEGVDWHYEVRWYPPAPVNADAGVAPTVRDP